MPIEVNDSGVDKTVQDVYAQENSTDKEVQEVIVHDSGVDKVAYTAYTPFLFASTFPGGVDKIDPTTMSVISTYNPPENPNIGAWGEGYLYVKGSNDTLQKLDPDTMQKVSEVTLPHRGFFIMTYGADGYIYGHEKSEDTVSKVDPSTMTVVTTYTGFFSTNYPNSLLAAPDGYLYAGCQDGVLRKLDADTFAVVDRHPVSGINLRSGPDHLIWDNGYLFYAGDDSDYPSEYGIVKIDPSNMSVVTTHRSTFSIFNEITMQILGDDGYIYAGTGDFPVVKVDPYSGSVIGTFSGLNYELYSLAFGDGFLYAVDRNADIVHKVDPSDMLSKDTYTSPDRTLLAHNS